MDITEEGRLQEPISLEYSELRMNSHSVLDSEYPAERDGQ
jgi:hypothetical protein